MTHPLAPYDALVVLGFGGPEGQDEVLPFLRRVTAGRGIPDERLLEVGAHYALFGGVSPINAQTRALADALGQEAQRRGEGLPVLVGQRNADPFLVDTLREAHAQGHRRVAVVLTSAYPGYSSCRQYREDIARALGQLADEGLTGLAVDKVRPYAHHPGFSRPTLRLLTEAVREAVATDPTTRVVFVTHSVPTANDETSGPGDGDGRLYSTYHAQLAAALLDELEATLGQRVDGDLVYCSRSGSPRTPWLEPDVNDHLEAVAASGCTSVVVAAIGFVSDHMEVIYDLDTEASATADRLGLAWVRVPTVGTDPEFVSGLVDLLEERAAQAREGDPTAPAGELRVPVAWPTGGEPLPAVCRAGCCPNLRTAAPAACGED